MADIQSNINVNINTSEALASIRTLQRQISAFYESMARSGAAASAAASNMQNNLINTINQTGKFSASIKTIASTTEAFTTSLEKNKLSMGQYFKFAGGASKTFGKFFKTEMDTIDKVARERVKTLQTQYIKLGRDASGALKSIAIRPLALDMEDLGTKTAIAAQKQQLMNQLLKQGSTNLLNFGKNTQWAGRQLMVGFTIPLAMVGTAAAKTFMKMEEQAIKFKRVYGDSMTPTAETDLMVKQIRDLATEFTKYGVAAEKTMELAATAAAAGKQGLELTAQVREANRLAVLGQVEQQDALSTTISITNAFGIAADQLAKKIDFLNAVENQTVTSIEDLTIAVPKAGPVVKQLGGDVEDLAFFLTAMKEGGINASEGANALKSGLAALINPTGKAADMLSAFGINVKGIVEANKGDVKGLVVDFAKALDTLDPLSRARAIEQLFGKFQFSRLSTLFQNVIAEGTQASRVLELTGRSAADLAALSSKELGTVAASSMFKFQKAVEELKIALAPIGEIFLKLITPLLEFGSRVLENFNKLDAGAKNFIVGLIAVVGGLGPVLIMTFGLLANGIANIIKGFMLVRNIFTKSGDSSRYLGDQTEYMTQQQLEAAGVAASLEQVHQRLEQRFTSEAIAVDKLTQALQRANNANLVYQGAGARVAPPAKRFAVGGFVSGPGTGTSDSIPAMLSNGEAVIPAKSVKKNRGLVEGLIAGNIPGFFKGGIMGSGQTQFLGMPRTAKQVTAGRENAEMVYQEFLKSGRFRNQQPENYVGQIQKSGGHSFPIFGLGGIYHKADGSNVFVKPVMNEVAALAELRGTIIAREAHGLIAPQQRIVVMRDPSDRTGTRRFLALESKVDPKLSTPTGKFSADQYFQQLLAASLRGDKDLSGDNIFENFLPDVGPAGVFNRASGLRDYEKNMPSVEQQATINLLGVKGGAKKAFAQSTADLIRSMTPEQYAEGMRKEVARVLPRLRQTIASLDLNDVERPFYADMITRLETAQGIDWRKFHYMHSMVQAPKPSQASSKVLKLANGIVSVPGPKGAGDVVPAMLSPGEAVVPAKQSKKYAGLIQGIVADNIPGYRKSNLDKSKIPAGGRQSTTDITLGGTTVSVSALQAPRIIEILQNAINAAATEFGRDITPELERNLAGLEKVTVKSVDEILKNFSGDIVRLATRVTKKTALEMAHADPGVVYSKEDTRFIGSSLQEQYPNRIHETMAKAEKPTRFLSQGVFGTPRPSNQQDMLYTGKENAEWARRYPEIFMDGIAKFGKLDPNDPRLKEFAMSVADEFEKAGSKSITESDFGDIVATTLSKEVDETIKEIVKKAQNTLQVVQQTNIGSKVKRRSDPGANDSFVIMPDGKQIGRKPGDAPAYTRNRDSQEHGAVAYAFHQEIATKRAIAAGIPELVNGIIPVVSGAVSTAVAEGTKEGARRSGSQTASAVEQGLNESTERKSPPKAAIRIGKDYGFALNGALRDLIPRVRVSGEAFGIAAATGMTTITPAMRQHLYETAGRIFRPYLDAQGNLITSSKQRIKVINDETIATKRATDADRMRLIAMQAQFVASMGGSIIPGFGGFGSQNQDTGQDDQQEKPKSKFERYSSGFRTATFALTSLAGAATMSGGAVGEAAGSIMAFSGIAYALITVMDLLSLAATNSKNAMLAQIGSFLMFSKGKAGGVGFLASLKNAVTPLSAAFVAGGKGFKGFINVVKTAGLNIGRFVIAALRFVPVIGWIIGGLTLLGFIVKGIIDAKERERLATEGVSDSLISTQKELDATAEALGKEKPKSVMDRIGFGGSAQSAQEQKSTVDEVRGNQAWLDEYKKDIDAMRTMSQRELQTYQNTLAIQLQATGQYTEDEIQGVIKALQLEAKRTDVALQFKSIDITKPGNIKNNLQRFATSAMDASATSLNKTQQKESENIATSGYYQSIISLATAFQNGVIDLKKYNDGVAEVRKSLESLGESTKKAQVQGIFNMFKDNLPETEKEFRGLLDGVSDSNQQLELMTLYTSGAISGLAQLKDVINAFNVVSAGLGPQIDQATLDAANRVLANVRATADKNNKETAKAFKDANDNVGGTKSVFQQATESLYDNVKAIKESTKAYSLLSKEGVSASDAFKIAKDPILAAALATTKVGTGKWKELVDRIREFLAITKTGGLSEKISELFGENQKLQNMEKLSRYLQQTGLDAEQVQEVLNDPELADQLLYATGEGKKGFDQIKKTVGFIMKNKEIKISLLPLTEQFKQKMSKVTEAFSAKKNVLDIQFRIDTRADQSIVRQAQEKINALNFQSDDYEAGLTRLQDGEEAINEKYDNRIQALDKVISANDRIANQNKEELNVFQMVARGDIAGAAAGIAQLQEQKAKDALEAKKASLEAQRTNELESLTAEVVVNGQKTRMTRNQIEENLKSIKEQIFNIEENTLEPAQRQIEKAQEKLDADNESLRILGLTEDEWLKIEANINESVTSTTAYVKQLQEALDIAKQIPGALAGTSAKGGDIVGKQDPVLETDFLKNPKLKTSTKPGSGPGGTPTTVDSTAAREAAASSRASEDSKLLAAAMSIPTYGQIFKYQAEIKKKRRGFFESEWERNDNQRNIDKFEAAPPQGYGKTAYTGQPWTDVKGPFDGVTVDGNLVQNVKWSPGGPMLRASGGYISGPGTGTSDSIPALLSNGEYVIRANAVKALGTDTLDRMNYADKNRFADGGQVGRPGGWSTSYETTATREAKAKADRDKLFKKGGAQGFEAGFQGMMSDFAKLEPVKAVGNFLGDKDNRFARDLRFVLGTLAIPSEIVGSVAKSFVTGVGQVSRGDYAGAAGTMFSSAVGGRFIDAISNAYSGVINPEEQRATMFEQAAQQVIKDKSFGAGNAESDAQARIVSGFLNILGDPLSYVGIGAAAKGVKTAGAAASKFKLAPKGTGIDRISGTRPLLDPNVSLVKSIITGKAQHGSSSRSPEASFELSGDGGNANNWFGANFFTTGSKKLAEEYGPTVYKLQMPISQAAKMPILDLFPGAKTMEEQFPGITKFLEGRDIRVDPWETLESASLTKDPAALQRYLENPNRHVNLTEGSRGQVLKEFGIKAVRHQSGHGVGSGNSKYSEVFAFFNPENMVAKKKIRDAKMLAYIAKIKMLSVADKIKRSPLNPGVIKYRLGMLKKYGPDGYNFLKGKFKEEDDPYSDWFGAGINPDKMSQQELKSLISGKKGYRNQFNVAEILAGRRIKNAINPWSYDDQPGKLNYNFESRAERDPNLPFDPDEPISFFPDTVIGPGDYRSPQVHQIKALDTSGRDAGYLRWDAKTGEIKMVFVSDEYQRKGVATDMWHKANLAALESNGKIAHPVHSPLLTQFGKPWSLNVGGGRLKPKFINPQTGDIDWSALLKKPNPKKEYLKTLMMTQDEIRAQQIKKYSHKLRAIGEGTTPTAVQTPDLERTFDPFADNPFGTFDPDLGFAKGGMVMPKNIKKSRAVSIKSLFRAANVDKSGTSRVDTPISPETLAQLKDKYPASLGVFKDNENYFTRDGVSGGATYNDPFMQSYYNQKFLHGITAKPTIARNILSAWAATGNNKGLMSGEGALGNAASLYRYIKNRAKRGTSGDTPGQEMIRDQINRAYLGIEELYNSVQKRSMGGLIKPKYFSNGDLARGTDVVPAMLTPGEFVMTKHAVDNYGVDNLRAINSGAAPGNSVYNGYNINVNVRSNSNPDQIANAVMTQIRQVNAQQVRGSKF